MAKRISLEDYLFEWDNRSRKFIDVAFAPYCAGLITIDEAISKGIDEINSWTNLGGFYTDEEEFIKESDEQFHEVKTSCIDTIKRKESPNWAISSGCLLMGIFPEGAENYGYMMKKVEQLKNNTIMGKDSRGTRLASSKIIRENVSPAVIKKNRTSRTNS